MKSLKLFFLLSFPMLSARAESSRKIVELQKTALASERMGLPNFPEVKITPDSTGLLQMTHYKTLVYFNLDTGTRVKIADIPCKNSSCFAISGDSLNVAYTQVVGEEMAIFLAPLPPAIGAPRKIGVFPRYAGAHVESSIDYQLNFCGSSSVLFARSAHSAWQGNVIAFDFSNPNVLRRDLFAERSGLPSPMKCGKGGVYFSAQTFAADSETQTDSLIRSLTANIQNPDKFREVLFTRESSLRDTLLRTFLPKDDGALLGLESPEWDEFGSLSFTFVKTSEERPLAALGDESFGDFLAASGGYLFFSRFLKFTGDLAVFSEQNKSVTSLVSSDYTVDMDSISISNAPGEERASFLEERYGEKRIVTSRINGAQRQVFAPVGQKIIGSTLTPSGKCIVYSRQSSSGATADLQLLSPQSKVTDLFQLKLEGIKLSVPVVAPDSSFVVFAANANEKKKFTYYKVSLPECVQATSKN